MTNLSPQSTIAGQASGCPRWHRTAPWSGWTGNVLLEAAVVAMRCWLLPHQSGSKNGSGNVGDGNTTLEKVCSELRKGLCSSKLQEGVGGKFCPRGWTLHRTECYWVANGTNPWSKSRRDCVIRGAELLMPGDQDELKPPRCFWIGLSIPCEGKGWTWLNGSRPDQHQFQMSRWEEGKTCGVLKDEIEPESCSVEQRWICQKEATQL
ncbi:PREDICTED: killer cell lectin-like receptor subfamily B member 1B allele B [Leptosomus discolor]|uniref:killer cell lectin-like receptor subfamily B member 1B allele B n=1 Tax=Leptosomus discolor TaxID=188344 RepID=UPI000522926E|nr:PREDICTED: killer cell lectin-like receptor subfamily B member 1B allele B [Leptosomus discolor]